MSEEYEKELTKEAWVASMYAGLNIPRWLCTDEMWKKKYLAHAEKIYQAWKAEELEAANSRDEMEAKAMGWREDN